MADVTRKRVGILISGRGSNMAALIEASRAADYPAEIALVISNRPQAAGLAIARSQGIATEVVDHEKFAERAAFDGQLQMKLDATKIELLCLAGFMRLLTAEFVARWRGRMLNIHPSLLPAFRGLDTHARALAAGVKIHGCTVHFVAPAVDSGEIVMQAAVPVFENDDAKTLAARVLVQEHRIYPAALRLLAEGRLRLDGQRVIVSAPPPPATTPLISPSP